MARRMGKLNQLIGNIFILILLCIIAVLYYDFVFITYLPKLSGINDFSNNIFYSIMFCLMNSSIFMFLWWMIQCIFTDPGRVPIYWGFYMGDP